MLLKSMQRFFLFSLVSLIFISGWMTQATLFPNHDVSWLLEASKRLLAGGTYTQDFFENNPPWVLYVYLIPVIISKIFSVHITHSLKIFTFCAAFISLWLSNYFLTQILKSFFIRALFVVILAILFLILPLTDLGQREHLWFILTMPYLLMMTRRLENPHVNTFLAVFVGFLAGSVFLLKPFFLMQLLLIEIYYAYRKKNILSWFRPEIITIFALLLLYALLLVTRHLDYLKVVMPFAYRWASWARPFDVLVTFYGATMGLLTLSFYVAMYEIDRYRDLTTIMCIALIGCLFSYFIQCVDSDYHVLPAVCIATCLFSLNFIQYISTPNSTRHVNIMMNIYLAMVLIQSCGNFNCIGYHILQYPAIFFSLMALLCILILSFIPRNNIGPQLRYLRILFLTLLISYAYFYITARFINWSVFHIASTSVVFVLSFASLISVSFKDKLRYANITLLGIVFYFTLYYLYYDNYKRSQILKPSYESLVSDINRIAHNQSIYFFDTDVAHIFPILNYTDNNTSASRFSSFCWTLPGFARQAYFDLNPQLHEQLSKDKNQLINLVVEDLEKNRPNFLFIDDLQIKCEMLVFKFNDAILSQSTNLRYFPHFPFDHLDFFSANTQFSHLFKNYFYVTHIENNLKLPINPLRFRFQLTYQQSPTDDQIKFRTLYLYLLKDHQLEVALRNGHFEVVRLKMIADKNGLDHDKLESIRQILLTGQPLNNKTKQDISVWLAKQSFEYPFYKFKIYAQRK